MSARPPERALRRAAEELAGLHPEDLAMILDALEPREKARLEALLGEGGPAAAPEPEPAAPVWTYAGVSPWLRARIDPDAPAGRSAPEFILMTADARDALAAAAEPCRTMATPSGPGLSLMSRIWRTLAGAPA